MTVLSHGCFMLGEEDTGECLRQMLELEGCGHESSGKPRFQPGVTFTVKVSAVLSKCFCGLLLRCSKFTGG